MAAPRVSVQVDGLMILVGLGALAAVAIYAKREAIGDALSQVGSGAVNLVNPNSSGNIANRVAEATVGAENLSSAFDYIYGAVDLVTYLTTGYEKDTTQYARQVYGVEDSWLFGHPGWKF